MLSFTVFIVLTVCLSVMYFVYDVTFYNNNCAALRCALFLLSLTMHSTTHSASEVTEYNLQYIWRYTNLFITIIISTTMSIWKRRLPIRLTSCTFLLLFGFSTLPVVGLLLSYLHTRNMRTKQQISDSTCLDLYLHYNAVNDNKLKLG